METDAETIYLALRGKAEEFDVIITDRADEFLGDAARAMVEEE